MLRDKSKQVILVILDGWGHREDRQHNAIAQANTPCFDKFWRDYPHSLLEASGEAVGLPAGQIGGSEVGHITMGAGKIIDNDFVRISKAVENGEFARNPALKQLFAHVKKNNSTLHVLGLLSPGGVHSHQEHLHEFLRIAQQAGIEKVAIHAFTDGRDTAPQSAHNYLRELELVIKNLGIGFIATATGRFYAMDRDNNWDRIAKAESAIFERQGSVSKTRQPSEVIAELHKQGVSDEHLEPIIFLDDNNQGYTIQENDGVFLFNFRADRMRQIARKIADRVNKQNLCFVTMTEYDQAKKSLNSLVMFPPVAIETTLAKEVSQAGLTQAHIAETDKYAHVTFFLNAAAEHPYAGEEYVLVDTRKDIKTHDLAPEMMAKEIADAALERLERGVNLVIINFANADIVGHSANYPAIIKAVETLDHQLKRLVDYAESHDATVFITADHGNAEVNIYPGSDTKHTAHSINPVPAILTRKDVQMKNGTLADVAPTILELLGLPKPPQMTGQSLLC